MLDLAITIDSDSRGIDIVETNHGERFKAPFWPRDCEFQIVAFKPGAKTCEVVESGALAEDIGEAIRALKKAGAGKGRRPEWFERLSRYADGAEREVEV
jgi:hypothetical protein